MERITLIHDDCLDYMRTVDSNHFDIAVVDPPYGIDAGNQTFGNRRVKFAKKDWDKSIPHRRYFQELRRVSRRQIIWGGNYFPLPKTGGWLFWDKQRGGHSSYSDGELAWTSFLTTLKICRILYDGFRGADQVRIHPTQKPIRLYDWIFKTYTQPGMKVLDTHLGSGSSAISAHYHDLDFVGCELDADYFAAASDRIRQETRQTELF